MKQKNPIRNEIVYLWKKEKIPNNHPHPQGKATNLDEELHKTSGEKSGKKSLENDNEGKRFISS